MTKLVLVPLATGFEEIETSSMVDVLRRANIEVILASIHPDHLVKGSRNITFQADALLSEKLNQSFNLIVLPGGMPGAEHLKNCELLIQLLKQQNSAKKWIGAICAAPAVVLQHHGFLKNVKATCYPAMGSQLSHFENKPVVVDQHFITSQGPGTALLFAIKLIEVLLGTAKAQEIAKEMLIN